MAIANYFNPNGTATDDIMQLKMLSDDNNGELDTVVNEQLISKYGSLNKLYDQYQTEQSAGAGAGIGNLPESDVAYNEKIAGLIAESGAGSGNDMMADYYNNQPDAVGQMQALVDQSGSGGEVIAASTTETKDPPNPKGDLTFGQAVAQIAGIPFQAVAGMYNKVGSAYETLTNEDKFASWLQSPQTQAGLRMIQEGGTPSFASPFARMSKALIDTSTYLSAAAEAKAGSKGTTKSTDLLYIPGQNPVVDALLKMQPHSESKGTMYDFLVDESMKNNYFKIGMLTNNGQLVGVDGVLKPNDANYSDETFENYVVGDNPEIDKLLKQAGLIDKITNSKTNKINITMGPMDKMFAIENIETDGVEYKSGEFFETYDPDTVLGKKIEARYPDQFKKGDQIKVEAFTGEINGEIQWGDLISVVDAANPKTQSTLEHLADMPRSVSASADVTTFKNQLDSSRKQAVSLNNATGALMTLDNPEDTLGALQNFFTPFANVIDRLMGDTAAGDFILNALVGSKDAFQAREEASAYLNSTVIPKLKDFYPVSDKDVAFIKQTMANLGTKSYFKLAAFYNGMYAFDERMNDGLQVFYQRMKDEQGITGYDFSPDGIKFDGKTYNEALRFARAWANKSIEEEWEEAIKDQKIIDAAKNMRGIKESDLLSGDIGNTTKLAIINYANSADKMVVDSEKIRANNKAELQKIFYGTGTADRATELANNIMNRRFAILGLIDTYKKSGKIKEQWAIDQITQQIDSFEDTYGLDYGTIGKEEWIGVEKDPQNFYTYVFNELNA
jgi:hypothetical protein